MIFIRLISKNKMDINLDWKTSYTLETPSKFIEKYKLQDSHINTVINTRNEIKNVLDGNSNKLIVITGPCSIHDKMSAIEYANLLASVKDLYPNLILVMRAYFEKPRTVLGWKGLIYDPDLNGSDNLAKGLTLSRQILLEIVSRGIPVGTEFLEMLQRELAVPIPETVVADKSKLYKNITDIYLSKGAEPSFKALFRLIFNDDIELFFPRVDILKPSDAKWDSTNGPTRISTMVVPAITAAGPTTRAV